MKNAAMMKKNAPKFVDDTHVLVTKEFTKNARIFGTPEYKMWKEIKEDCKGYLVPRKENSNVYDFYEVPKRKEDKEAVSPCELNSLPDGNDDLRGRLVTSQGNKEIYNNTYNLIDKNINSAEFIF